jgi:NADP-dependent 3-hydroxy acid dehydrogenase YdfG
VRGHCGGRCGGPRCEALRQEVTTRYLRVSLVEPGAVDTELVEHNRPEILAGLTERFAHQERMQASDIAEIISFIVTRPRRTAINEVLVRPTQQER